MLLPFIKTLTTVLIRRLPVPPDSIRRLEHFILHRNTAGGRCMDQAMASTVQELPVRFCFTLFGITAQTKTASLMRNTINWGKQHPMAAYG